MRGKRFVDSVLVGLTEHGLRSARPSPAHVQPGASVTSGARPRTGGNLQCAEMEMRARHRRREGLAGGSLLPPAEIYAAAPVAIVRAKPTRQQDGGVGQ